MIIKNRINWYFGYGGKGIGILLLSSSLIGYNFNDFITATIWLIIALILLFYEKGVIIEDSNRFYSYAGIFFIKNKTLINTKHFCRLIVIKNNLIYTSRSRATTHTRKEGGYLICLTDREHHKKITIHKESNLTMALKQAKNYSSLANITLENYSPFGR